MKTFSTTPKKEMAEEKEERGEHSSWANRQAETLHFLLFFLFWGFSPPSVCHSDERSFCLIKENATDIDFSSTVMDISQR